MFEKTSDHPERPVVGDTYAFAEGRWESHWLITKVYEHDPYVVDMELLWEADPPKFGRSKPLRHSTYKVTPYGRKLASSVETRRLWR